MDTSVGEQSIPVPPAPTNAAAVDQEQMVIHPYGDEFWIAVQCHILQQEELFKQELEKERKELVISTNNLFAVAYNASAVRDSDDIRPLTNAAGAVPDSFPATRLEVLMLPSAEVTALLAFYGLAAVPQDATHGAALGTMSGYLDAEHAAGLIALMDHIGLRQQ